MKLREKLTKQDRKDEEMMLRKRGVALTPEKYVNNLKLHRVTNGEEGKVKYFLQGRDGMMASLVYNPHGFQDEMSIRILYPNSLVKTMKRRKGTYISSTEIKGSRFIMENMSFSTFEEKVRRAIKQTYGEINDIY